MSDVVADNRSNQRSAIRVSKTIEFLYSANCPAIKTRLQDISETGAFVDTIHPLTVGSQVDFAIRLPFPEDSTPINGRGRVVWAQPMVGFGLEFQHLSDEDRKRIRFFIASVYFGPGGPASALV